MVTAAERVVNITELLESILLQVDTRTLLLSQRTCKSFHSTITGSPKLQRALFFQQDTAACLSNEDPSRNNPLFLPNDRDLRLRIPNMIPVELDLEQACFDINGTKESYEYVGPAIHKRASWRRMYLRSFSEGRKEAIWINTGKGAAYFRTDGDVTLGEMFEKALEMVEKHKTCPSTSTT